MNPALVKAARILFGLTVVFIVYATTIPWDLAGLPDFSTVQWIPLWDTNRNRIASIPDIVQNVVFFLPFGALLVAASPLAKKPIVIAAAVACVLGASLSMFVEFLQTMSPSRSSSATDVFTNGSGALLGAAAASLFLRYGMARTIAWITKSLRSQPGLLVVAAYFGWVLFGSLSPFIPSLDVGLLRASVRRFIDVPWGQKPIGALVPDFFLYLGLCFVVGRELRSTWGRYFEKALPRPAAFFAAAYLCTALGLAVELAQIILRGHTASLADVATAAAGSLAGAIIGAALGRKAFEGRSELGGLSRTLGPLVLVWIICLIGARALSPLDFVSVAEAIDKIEWRSFVPFAANIQKTNLATVTNVVIIFAYYAPLGWWLGARGIDKFVASGIAFGTAIIMEVGQLFVANRVFDISEGIFAALAAGAAAWGLGHLEEWRKNLH